MAIFRFFKMAAAAILDFRNFKFLTVGAVKRVEMHQRAKFCQNRINRGRDMAIFRFFKMAAAAILDFENFKFLTVRAVKRVELHHRAKFRQNRTKRSRGPNYVTMPNFVEIGPNAAEILQFIDFSRWRLPPSWILKI